MLRVFACINLFPLHITSMSGEFISMARKPEVIMEKSDKFYHAMMNCCRKKSPQGEKARCRVGLGGEGKAPGTNFCPT